ncbi:MAG: hypothetical protein A2078_14160 [Nitrospirae bacterium GWC2_57_9]|nr:MAG: hypothetical protein A2078_14160 [Nitrospirae bacterium GWC2_57_9]
MASITKQMCFFEQSKPGAQKQREGQMKIIMRIALVIVLFTAGFGAGFPIGRNRGFSTGSEWAFVQANIHAREAGVFMPVNYEAGQFRIILKQPKHIYRNAQLLADRHEDEMAYMSRGDRILNDRLQLTQNALLLE